MVPVILMYGMFHVILIDKIHMSYVLHVFTTYNKVISDMPAVLKKAMYLWGVNKSESALLVSHIIFLSLLLRSEAYELRIVQIFP